MSPLPAAAAEYWSTPAPMTQVPGTGETPSTGPAALPAGFLDGLPSDPVALCRIAEGVIIHEFWAGAYGRELSDEARSAVCTRPVNEILAGIAALDASPLTEQRTPDRRLVGNCRMFSTLSVGLLRRAGIPGRARCGFAGYFEKGLMVDHWIVETWDEGRDRWRVVDPQLDELQRNALQLGFDPDDMPPGRFLSGPEAWLACSSGADDPSRFGILDMFGQWFIRGNTLRDLASLNKVELLPWDVWGAAQAADRADGHASDEVTGAAAAAVTAALADDDVRAIRAAYDDAPLLRVPTTILDARCDELVTVPA